MKAPGRRAELRASGPAVTKRVELSPSPESQHPTLSLDHADQALISYALHLAKQGLNILLLTDDTICSATAEDVGLPTLLVAEHWLREPEPDENAKENARLKAELRRLSEAEPKVSLSFRSSDGKPLTRLEASIVRWPALSEPQIDQLMEEVGQRCPPARSFERRSASSLPRLGGALAGMQKWMDAAENSPLAVYEPATDEEITRYKEDSYPNWLSAIRTTFEKLHLELNGCIQWPTVEAAAVNEGTRPATKALLGIRARGAFAIRYDAGDDQDEDDTENQGGRGKSLHDIKLALPPSPPRGHVKNRYDGLTGLSSLAGVQRNTFGLGQAFAMPVPLPQFPNKRQADAFYWREGREGWVEAMELECESWRHGQNEWTFSLMLRPREAIDVSGAIELGVHADNVSDPPLTRLPIHIIVEDDSTMDAAQILIDALERTAQRNGLF
jgi:hypothetical protein